MSQYLLRIVSHTIIEDIYPVGLTTAGVLYKVPRSEMLSIGTGSTQSEYASNNPGALFRTLPASIVGFAEFTKSQKVHCLCRKKSTTELELNITGMRDFLSMLKCVFHFKKQSPSVRRQYDRPYSDHFLRETTQRGEDVTT